MKNTYKFKDSELLNKVLNDFDYSFQFGIHQIDALNNDKKDNFFVSLFKNPYCLYKGIKKTEYSNKSA